MTVGVSNQPLRAPNRASVCYGVGVTRLGGLLGLLLCSAIALGSARAEAQDALLVLIVDPGPTRLNQGRLTQAIGQATHREVIRMADPRAPSAGGRLTIAFSRPNRWVLRYESRGQVAWVTDRVVRPGHLRDRLTQLSVSVVSVIDGMVERQPQPAALSSRWDDVILALQNEIVDPFEDDPPRAPRPATAMLWSEVVNPFSGRGSRASSGELWSEVLDPWAADAGRRR